MPQQTYTYYTNPTGGRLYTDFTSVGTLKSLSGALVFLCEQPQKSVLGLLWDRSKKPYRLTSLSLVEPWHAREESTAGRVVQMYLQDGSVEAELSGEGPSTATGKDYQLLTPAPEYVPESTVDASPPPAQDQLVLPSYAEAGKSVPNRAKAFDMRLELWKASFLEKRARRGTASTGQWSLSGSSRLSKFMDSIIDIARSTKPDNTPLGLVVTTSRQLFGDMQTARWRELPDILGLELNVYDSDDDMPLDPDQGGWGGWDSD